MSGWTKWFGKLLGVEQLESIDGLALSFGAGWARTSPFLVVLGACLFVWLGLWFYRRYHAPVAPRWRVLLGLFRGAVLVLLLLVLADPIISLRFTNRPSPGLWVLFDGSDSMAIEDTYTDAERKQLADDLGSFTEPTTKTSDTSGETKLARQALIRQLVSKSGSNTFETLAERFRLKAFVLDRPDGVRELEVPGEGPDDEASGRKFVGKELAEKLTTKGEVTALGRGLEDLALRHAGGHLAGVLVVGDFDQNSGPPSVAAAKKLGVPVFTLGVGAEAAVDLAVDVQAPLILKKAERAGLTVTVRQTGLTGASVKVRLAARRLAGEGVTVLDAEQVIGEKTVTLTSTDQPLEFPYVPVETGRFQLVASVDPQPGELIDRNNQASREVSIRDDFLRLLFVEYEPTWEWRFVKEVFHRDKLVGMRGFRTFLRSADPNVRKTNELFVSTLTPKRGDFFANDVLFLGDMPASALGNRFCEMTKEFVGKFGGGLVVMAGPRFGPGQLAQTELAEMLPVVVEPASRPRDAEPFTLRLTAEAEQIDFMRLGETDADHAKGWRNLGPLPWYQPVSRLHPLATALAVHPKDTAADGKTPQPIIAIRRYGRGEVIYLGFNETWRLRKRYGEQYYRQFWGQMIHRLGLSHALGSQKRFVVRTDRQQYQPDDKVVLTVEAYNANFEPLTDEDLPDRKLTGDLVLPGVVADGTGGRNSRGIGIPQLREGVFETRLSVAEPGEHRVLVKDPVTGEVSDVHFQVSNLSVERRTAVRNVSLQEEIARATGGKAFDIHGFNSFVSEFQPEPKKETSLRVQPLWNTWLVFGTVLGLLFAEWLIRKALNLA